MKRPRSELVKGMILLVAFFGLIVTVSLVPPYSTSQSGYTLIDIRRIIEAPSPLEGHKISSSTTITSIASQGFILIGNTTYGVLLVFAEPTGDLSVGDHVVFRGVSWVASNNSIIVQEFYIHQANSSTLRSIPGIVLFVMLFFGVYTIDLDELAFVGRS